ncbi:MAG: DUF1836 domain-containing protein [Hespellia sp.]|nr:DUF1836 domain-containing protein [Hespellia sp.]
MTINTDDMLNSILESLSRIDYIKAGDIPNIDLYMDQVTTFMDAQLSSTKRYDEDKILTKTMINNYAKNNLLPPPEKKKYSKEHVLVLIFIYYFKNILSIRDIETLLHPIIERFFASDSDFDISSIYEGVCSMQKNQLDNLKNEITEKFNLAETAFPDAPEDTTEYMQLFAFICNLSFDVYVKKLLIEKLVDELPIPDSKKK